MIIKNGLVFTPEGTFEKKDLYIEGEYISNKTTDNKEVEAEGCYVIPGLVDIHFHGCVRHDMCDGTEESIQALADYEAANGVLAICPATMTIPEDQLMQAMKAAKEHKNGKGADLVGINMEGPFVNKEKKGAQKEEDIKTADVDFFHRMQDAARDSECFVELICDGVHIHPSCVRATFEMFTDKRIVLISDSMMATGMDDGQYELGGQPVTVVGNLATLTEGGAIAGSATNLMDCMRTAVKKMNIPLESAVRCATLNPAKSIGIDDKYGSLEEGKYANAVVLDKDLNIVSIIQKGQVK